MTDEYLWPNYYDIVILPPPAVQEHAIALSKHLERYGSKFVLGTAQFIPHISLYHIPVRVEQFAVFTNAVRDVAATTAGGVLRLVALEIPVVMTDKPEWLIRLHEQIVGRTCTFLDREYDVDSTWNTSYLPPELAEPARRYLKEFGSPLVHEVFRPHITLTSFEDKSVVQTIAVPEFDRLSFEVDTVSICELGPSHTCQRTLATYPLMS